MYSFDYKKGVINQIKRVIYIFENRGITIKHLMLTTELDIGTSCGSSSGNTFRIPLKFTENMHICTLSLHSLFLVLNPIN